VRVSGPLALGVAAQLLGRAPTPRMAHYLHWRDDAGEVIDDGLLLFFPAPHSYTGEDVLELQGHGNPLLLQQTLRRCLQLGARMARAGEFTERAFLNGRLDLAQAEAVADLIAASSEAALRAARRSLAGVFSQRAQALVEAVIAARVWLEAALDFPEEEIDFLSSPALAERLQAVRDEAAHLLAEAERGRRLRDGLHVVIVGAPNAGKSSLLNALAGEERAIVTAQAGTTRDLLREAVRVDGVEITLVDTAGLREAAEAIEAEGIRRARAELGGADLALAVLDDRHSERDQAALAPEVAEVPRVLWLHNKCDLSGHAAGASPVAPGHLWLSAPTGAGLSALHQALREAAGAGAEGGSFSARTRHVQALTEADAALTRAVDCMQHGQGELAAEELRTAQAALEAIAGRFSADDLLGRVFADFCIGK
jgi:tRNA modification GTPase